MGQQHQPVQKAKDSCLGETEANGMHTGKQAKDKLLSSPSSLSSTSLQKHLPAQTAPKQPRTGLGNINDLELAGGGND